MRVLFGVVGKSVVQKNWWLYGKTDSSGVVVKANRQVFINNFLELVFMIKIIVKEYET